MGVQNVMSEVALVGGFALGLLNLLDEREDFARRQSARAKSRLSKLQAQRERQRTIKAARQARAQTRVQAEQQGITGASSAITAETGIQAQEAANISFLDVSEEFGGYISAQEQEAADAAGRKQTIGAISSIATSYGQKTGG